LLNRRWHSLRHIRWLLKRWLSHSTWIWLVISLRRNGGSGRSLPKRSLLHIPCRGRHCLFHFFWLFLNVSWVEDVSASVRRLLHNLLSRWSMMSLLELIWDWSSYLLYWLLEDRLRLSLELWLRWLLLQSRRSHRIFS
jgi:hypothetical protein